MLHFGQRAQAFAAPAHQLRHGGSHAGHALHSPCGGNGMSKASSPMVFARVSSFSCSQAGSSARMSIDSVFATAPRPRGCSLPLTQTSNGMRLAVFDVADEQSEVPVRMFDHVSPGGLPSASVGRPGQRRLASTGSGTRLDVRCGG